MRCVIKEIFLSSSTLTRGVRIGQSSAEVDVALSKSPLQVFAGFLGPESRRAGSLAGFEVLRQCLMEELLGVQSVGLYVEVVEE